jgi:hypothetical protein
MDLVAAPPFPVSLTPQASPAASAEESAPAEYADFTKTPAAAARQSSKPAAPKQVLPEIGMWIGVAGWVVVESLLICILTVHRTRDLRKAADGLSTSFLAREIVTANELGTALNRTLKDVQDVKSGLRDVSLRVTCIIQNNHRRVLQVHVGIMAVSEQISSSRVVALGLVAAPAAVAGSGERR